MFITLVMKLAHLSETVNLDNAAIVSDLCKQYEAGALSKQSFIEQSPYTNDAEQEMKRIAQEGTVNAAAGF